MVLAYKLDVCSDALHREIKMNSEILRQYYKRFPPEVLINEFANTAGATVAHYVLSPNPSVEASDND